MSESNKCTNFYAKENHAGASCVGMILRGGNVHEMYGGDSASPERCRLRPNSAIASNQVTEQCRGNFKACKLLQIGEV